MLPMVPSNRDNMIAWLAAHCDGLDYGSMIGFRFPKEKLIYGPAQIEAWSDQDTSISQQLSLWNQTGSCVIRGNLLVVPIDDALPYVEPLYLSAENRQLPELERLIASSGGRVAMGENADAIFAALFAGEEGAPTAGTVAASLGTPPETSAAQASAATGSPAEALRHYRTALAALRDANWEAFGREMDALGSSLEGGGAPSP